MSAQFTVGMKVSWESADQKKQYGTIIELKEKGAKIKNEKDKYKGLLKDLKHLTPVCNLKEIESEIQEKNERLKELRNERRICKSKDFKYGKENITMNELINIIKKENKENVKEFLELFPSTEDRVKGVNVTRNHVYEALWIIVYLKNLDDNTRKKQFFKSLENGEPQTEKEVLEGKVNSGNEGGIADLYFEIIDKGDEIVKNKKISCNGQEILIPHCENKTIQSYSKYLFSSKFYRKVKGVTNYDIQDIYTEATEKGLKEFNIVLLVQGSRYELEKKMDKSNKSLSKLCHAIYDIDNLDDYYKQLLHQLKHKEESHDTIKRYIQPRFHQEYFIEYTKKSMDKSKKFVWGAVPRSGKSFMIGGLISKIKPKYVFLILGAITETKDQFIKMFNEYDDFSNYKIHDLQLSHGKPEHVVLEGKHIFVCSQEAIRMHNKKDSLDPKLLHIFKEERDKIVFFDEIHQGSGEGSLQEDFLTELVLDNEYKAFVMVTATFAKPLLKYMNKGKGETKLIQWRYDDIHLMKTINKKIIDDETGEEKLVVYEKIKENILEENDGILKLEVFNDLLKEYNERGINLDRLVFEYQKYPELIVSTPILTNIENDFDSIIVGGNIAIDKIFKPLMKKNMTDKDTATRYIQYIQKYIYEKYILQTLNKGNLLRKPHSEIWFLPTIFRGEKGDEEVDEEDKNGKKSPFGYMTKNFSTLLMQKAWFREKYCILILHSVGFGNIAIDFIQAKEKGGKQIKWNDASVRETGNTQCISTICPKSKIGVKECILEQEACAKAHGKSIIILTGKMLRLGISLPCVDIALHMDPIQSVDTIYQSMFRVLTEREGKTEGLFIDMLTTRQISFMYEYMDYTSKTEKVFSGKKKMKKLLEKLLLFNFNGINFQSGQEYHNLYNQLMNDFSLDDINKFNKNIRKIDVSEVDEMLQNFDETFIEEFHDLLVELKIRYKEGKKKKGDEKKRLGERKGTDMSPDEYREIEVMGHKKPLKVKKTPELKEKYNEVSNFINDIIILFALFLSDEYDDIQDNKKYRIKIMEGLDGFFEKKIDDIKKECESLDLDDTNVIDCHFMNIIKSDVKNDELHDRYNELKTNLKGFFENIKKNNEDNFFKIYYGNIEDMKRIKKSSQNLKKIEPPCSESFINDEKVLKIIRDRLTVREEEKNLYGEVFTPIELICKMFYHIPDKVWENKDLKWLDPANGIGNFPVVAYYKLMDSLKSKISPEAKRSKHIIENMLYMVELNPVNVRVCKKIFKMIDPKATPNIVKHDFLTFKGFKGIDKFDVIMGNPPFQDKGGKSGKGGHDLYPDFFNNCVNKILNDNGYIIFITGNKWRAPDKKGSLKTMWDIFQNMNTRVLRIYSKEKTGELFNVAARVDYYLVQKNNKYNGTDLIDEKGIKNKIDIRKWDFLPNYNYPEIEKIITSEEKGIKIIYSASMYEGSARNKNLNKSKNGNFKYPVRHSHTIKDGEVIYWTNEKKGHFGVPKVILIKGTYIYPLNDYEGEYGMTNYSFGIPIKSKKEGDDIVKALNTKEFLEIISATKWQSGFTDHNMFKYFKPDFYKHFLGKPSSKESDNVPEPEPEPEPDAPQVLSKSRTKKKSKSKSKEKKLTKKKCKNPKHPPPPCKEDMYDKNGCCYKKKKQIQTQKKKKGGRRKNKRTTRKRRR